MEQITTRKSERVSDFLDLIQDSFLCKFNNCVAMKNSSMQWFFQIGSQIAMAMMLFVFAPSVFCGGHNLESQDRCTGCPKKSQFSLH